MSLMGTFLWMQQNFGIMILLIRMLWVIVSGMECTGYTGTPDFHVNNDGIGYMGFTSYGADSDTDPPKSHTFFYKQTEDYGETWSTEGDIKIQDIILYPMKY